MAEGDEPIYLMCSSFIPASMFWYVIEEKDDSYEKEHDPIPKRKQNKELTDEGEIEVLCESESDTIRSLRLPTLSHSHIICNTQFAVFNSCLYMFGGYEYDQDLRVVRAHTLVRLCDLNLQKGWQVSASFDSPLSYPTAVYFNNGSLFIEGDYHAFWINYSINSNHSYNLDVKMIPLPRPPKRFCHQYNSNKSLALWDTDVVLRMTRKYEFDSKYAVCYNLLNRKWHGIDDDHSYFDGIWSKGVVLYHSYLFLFGTIDPLNKAPSLRVYNLVKRKWLPDLTQYAKFDKKKVLPPLSCFDAFPMPLLLQVRDNKLALVWSEYIERSQAHPHPIIHCTKFIILKPSDSNDILVRPKVVSHGAYRVDGVLISAAARVTVTEDDEGNLDKRRAKDQCHKIAEHDSSVNHTMGENKERRGRLYLARKCKKPKI